AISRAGALVAVGHAGTPATRDSLRIRRADASAALVGRGALVAVHHALRRAASPVLTCPRAALVVALARAPVGEAAGRAVKAAADAGDRGHAKLAAVRHARAALVRARRGASD